jgi:cysteine synthase A
VDSWNWTIENPSFLKRTIARARERSMLLPTFRQLAHPDTIPQRILKKLAEVDPQAVHPLNLFRIHWRNDPESGGIGEINAIEIPREITGIRARIIGLIGKHFPTGAHKVGATYGCLAPYLVSGRFDPEYHKAVWPSTGNYCRGGAFNSALLGVHAVAILPEQMSRERFDWLRAIGAEVFATPGCESNVKEIYDKCHELRAQSDQYLIFNQFDQFGNSVWHYEVTGSALEELFAQVKGPRSRFSAFVSATGSAGTIAAGDYLREKFPAIKVQATEALQCPTLLMNGFGAHRIEGIGDKHVPWIHNLRNTDLVCAVNDEDPLRILRLFNEKEGRDWLFQQGVNEPVLHRLSWLGISSIANIVASIKLTRYFELGDDDVIFTIFTDSADLYQSRLHEMTAERGPYSAQQAELDWRTCLERQSVDWLKELTYLERKAVHNLKYFTWVEQQGKDVDELNAQWYDRDYWRERFTIAPVWDQLIEQFNAAVASG